ncbi:MAG: peptidoglycan-associated lipoprotein Pal [Syntrophaceae bacterium]|nr:peptidoglycan-associated lipoprotein Pal [Syntrophaceae bacterium]
MMKKKMTMMGILLVAVFSLALFSGCAEKKAVVAEGTAQEQSSAAQDAAKLSAAAAQEALKDINFDFDRSNIGPEARGIMKANADILLKNSDFNIIVEGHCDERGTSEYNMALGERRAQEAKKYLINLGVDGARMKTISYGEERPLDSGSNEEAWAKNRRAHFRVVQ